MLLPLSVSAQEVGKPSRSTFIMGSTPFEKEALRLNKIRKEHGADSPLLATPVKETETVEVIAAPPMEEQLVTPSVQDILKHIED